MLYPPSHRRAAQVVLALFVALLMSSVFHDRVLHSASSGPCCVFCNATLAPSPPAQEAERPSERAVAAAPRRPEGPILRFCLKLDHSGGAPPLA